MFLSQVLNCFYYVIKSIKHLRSYCIVDCVLQRLYSQYTILCLLLLFIIKNKNNNIAHWSCVRSFITVCLSAPKQTLLTITPVTLDIITFTQLSDVFFFLILRIMNNERLKNILSECCVFHKLINVEILGYFASKKQVFFQNSGKKNVYHIWSTSITIHVF